MTLGVWEYERDEDALQAAALVAGDRLEAPDFEVEVVSGRGDYLTVQITSGALTDPAAILHVENGGLFEIVRVEPWPGRVLLVLRARPRRDASPPSSRK